MKVTVGILNWNTADTLRRSLDVLNEELKDIPHKVVVVDQGSIDNTPDVISTANEFWNNMGFIQFIDNEINVGISIGKNQCIEEREGDYLFLMDGDVMPVPNSLKLMIQFLDEHPDKHAIGAYPNKWTNQENKDKQEFYEIECNILYDPKEHNGTCLYYGLYRNTMFDDGLRMCEEGEFGKQGYGWEDHDFFYQMKEKGIKQYVAHINNPQGHYYHKINSSLKHKDCIPKNDQREMHIKRRDLFRKRWKDGA